MVPPVTNTAGSVMLHSCLVAGGCSHDTAAVLQPFAECMPSLSPCLPLSRLSPHHASNAVDD